MVDIIMYALLLLDLIADSDLEYIQSITNFVIYIINFRLAIYGIRRCKNK